VLTRFGTWALLRFVLSLLLFLALHMMRAPFLLIAHLLDVAMTRVDNAVTSAVSPPDAMGGAQ